jgi:hypothetical protein
MTDRIFEQLSSTLASAGPAAVLAQLAEYLRDQQRYHELFEARKLQVRQALGLPLLSSDSLESMAEHSRDGLEAGLIDACREVGLLLLRSGRIRDGWHYLRAVGDRALVKRELASLDPTDERRDELIELCVHEGLDLHRGFQILIGHYGTCNSITTFDSAMYGRPRCERAVGAALLVEHLHEQLRTNVLSHVVRQEGHAPADTSLPALLSGRPWLFEQGTYHVDTTHLASVMRIARDLDDPQRLRLSVELADYGERLDRALQYAGDEPFEDLYPTSSRYFRALLGQQREDYLAYFRLRAEQSNPREDTTLSIETYVDLLARLRRHDEALREALRLLPEGVQQTGRAPSLLELAAAADNYAPLLQVTRQRGDAVGFAMSLLRARI